MIRQPLLPVLIRALVSLFPRRSKKFHQNLWIGFEIARSLAKHGCQVILACRNLTKGEAACVKIRKEQVYSDKTDIRSRVID